MGKQKSSASSATRKKHARKALESTGPIIPIAKPSKKDKKAAGATGPRQKVYIAPPKAQKADQDPLDVLGLNKSLPAELVVVLRRFAKKDEITKRRALEELLSGWVEKAKEDPVLESVLVEALPVWYHRFTSLFLHPSHQIRLLAIDVHTALLRLPLTRTAIILHLTEMGDPDQIQAIIGAWCLSAWDVDRTVAARGRKFWDASLASFLPLSASSSAPPSSLTQLCSFLVRAIHSPPSLAPQAAAPKFSTPQTFQAQKFAALNSRAGSSRGRQSGPTRVSQVPMTPPTEQASGDETNDTENEDDRNARIRIAALGALKWLFSLDQTSIPSSSTTPPTSLIADFDPLLSSAAFWSLLHHAERPPFFESDEDGLSGYGWTQPGVRKAMWGVVQILANKWKDQMSSNLPLISSAVLRSAWVEPDAGVRGAMWEPLLVFLTKVPESWTLDVAASSNTGDGDDEDEDEPDEEDEEEFAARPEEEQEANAASSAVSPAPVAPRSDSYVDFLDFLRTACRGSPLHGYPTIMVVLSTIPTTILPYTLPAIQELLAAFWGDTVPDPAQVSFTDDQDPKETEDGNQSQAGQGRTFSSLDQVAGSKAFVSALLESIMFLSTRLLRTHALPPPLATPIPSEALPNDTSTDSQATLGDNEGKAIALQLISEQYTKLWSEISQGRIQCGAKNCGVLLGRALGRIESLGAEIFNVAWAPIGATPSTSLHKQIPTQSSTVKTSLAPSSAVSVDFLALFAALDGQLESGTRGRDALQDLVRKVVSEIVGRLAHFCETPLVGSIPTIAEEQEEEEFAAKSDIAPTQVAKDPHEAVPVDPAFATSDSVILVALLQQFAPFVLSDADLLVTLDELMQVHLRSLVVRLPPREFTELLTTYINERQDLTLVLSLWQNLLSLLGSGELPARHPRSLLSLLLDKVHQNILPSTLKPLRNELNSVMSRAIHSLASEEDTDPEDAKIWVKLMGRPEPFLRRPILEDLIRTLTAIIHDRTELLLRDERTPLAALKSCLSFTSALLDARSSFVSDGGFARTCMADVYVLAHILPGCGTAITPLDASITSDSRSSDAHFGNALLEDVHSFAAKIWKRWLDIASKEIADEVVGMIRDLMQDLLIDIQARPSHRAIVEAARALDAARAEEKIMTSVILDQDTLDEMFTILRPPTFYPGMILFHPSIPIHAQARTSSLAAAGRYDNQGFSRYGRAADALTQVLAGNRQLAKKNLWALRHVLSLALYAKLQSAVPGFQSPVFTVKVEQSELNRIERMAKEIEAYLMAFGADEEWHRTLVAELRNHTASGKGGEHTKAVLADEHARVVALIFDAAFVEDGLREAFVLQAVLQSLMSNATRAEADIWLGLAQTIEQKAPQTSLAILEAIVQNAPEPIRLERYRNDIASRLSAVPASKANGEGMRLLRHLNVVAPPLNSESIFMPQQRGIFLIQAMQKWLMSDEELDEAIETHLTYLFSHLAPIIQNVPGAHWEFIFDLMENNLKHSSLDNDECLDILGRTLDLTSLVMDLASTNAALRSEWNQRRNTVLVVIRDMLAVRLVDVPYSSPRAYCRAEVTKIVGQLPNALIERDCLSKMCHLLQDNDTAVQLTSYPVLKDAAKKQTEHLVLEAAVETESDVKFEIPLELAQMLQGTLELELELEEDREGSVRRPGRILGHLLAWMLAFDLFEDASLKVRAGYLEQIRNAEMIGNHFLPLIFALLNLRTGGKKPFKLDGWGVNWFSVVDFEHGPRTLSLLAAHAYYRSLLLVPSLIRNWWLDCKDRQFTNTMATYTSSYFSPVIIQDELALVKNPSVSADLQDEAMTVKVAFAVGEVSALYTVDEQQMEIGIKMPSDFPLRGIEVKDVKRLGVDERKWRAWLLGVQQVTTQSGRIVDGLLQFKRNVKLHFEGQVECAICYSIISVMDQSLPTKPCKTCKNRFHGSCLFKWFKSSHNSSCPLCRSDML